MSKQRLRPILDHLVGVYRLFATRNLHTSAGSALVTRATALIVNIAGVPIVLSLLGPEQYGALMVLSGVAAWIGLGSFGLNGFVTSEIAKRRNDREHLGHVLADGFAITAVLATIALAIVSMGLYGAFRWGWLGLRDIQHWPGAGASTLFLLGITFVQLLLSPVEAAQLGLQKSWLPNLMRGAGNILSCFLIFLLPLLPQSMLFPALALFMPATIAMIVNAAPYVRLALHHNQFHYDQLARNLQSLRLSLPFFVISLHALCVNTFTTVYVSALSGPTEAATMSVFFRVVTIAMSIPVLVTGPLWAAIIDARHQSDISWVRKMTLATFIPMLSGALLFCVGFAIFGGWVVRGWTNQMIHFDPMIPALCGAVLFVLLWNHLWGTLLMGFGIQSFVAKVQLIELAVMFGLGAFLVVREGTLGMFEAMLVAMVACSGVAFPFAAVSKIHLGRTQIIEK